MMRSLKYAGSKKSIIQLEVYPAQVIIHSELYLICNMRVQLVIIQVVANFSLFRLFLPSLSVPGKIWYFYTDKTNDLRAGFSLANSYCYPMFKQDDLNNQFISIWAASQLETPCYKHLLYLFNYYSKKQEVFIFLYIFAMV